MSLSRIFSLWSDEPSARDVTRTRMTMISPKRLSRLIKTAEQALRAEKGDVLEFGVALGGSALLLASKAKRSGCRFAGFDVFDLHPPPSDNDDDASKARYEVIASGQAEGIGGDVYYGYRTDLYESVCNAFQRYGMAVEGNQIQLLKGYFEETWPAFEHRPVAFAHVDVSWHDPVRYGLEAVAPVLTPSGRIVVNTYQDALGSRRAVDGFLADHPDFIMDLDETPIPRRA